MHRLIGYFFFSFIGVYLYAHCGFDQVHVNCFCHTQLIPNETTRYILHFVYQFFFPCVLFLLSFDLSSVVKSLKKNTLPSTVSNIFSICPTSSFCQLQHFFRPPAGPPRGSSGNPERHKLNGPNKVETQSTGILAPLPLVRLYPRERVGREGEASLEGSSTAGWHMWNLVNLLIGSTLFFSLPL